MDFADIYDIIGDKSMEKYYSSLLHSEKCILSGKMRNG